MTMFVVLGGEVKVTAVIVTYGRRWHLLEQSLAAALEAGSDNAIVVDNGSKEDISKYVSKAFPQRVIVLRLDVNTGSAGGFHAGITAAMTGGAEYILLLDDDNCPKKEAISELERAFQDKLAQTARDRLCVVACKLQNYPGIQKRENEPQAWQPGPSAGQLRNAFLGFDLVHSLERFVRRNLDSRRGTDRDNRVKPSATYRVTTAPYGGMFFHRSLIDRFGYPDRHFVLYQDDIEFTLRISCGGGQVWFIRDAHIEAVDRSWFRPEMRMSALELWLTQGSDMRVFYTVRNCAYIEARVHKPSLRRSLNRCVFVSALIVLSSLYGKWKRVGIIMDAVRFGEAGHLGTNSVYPLE